MLDREAIKAIIPHREPFLLIDRIEYYEPGVKAAGELDVTEEMFWVPGHFPGRPVMPGVLVIEACAQVGAVVMLSMPENAGKIALFGGVDKVRFKRQVVPGDTLRLETEITKSRGHIGFGSGRAWVGDELAFSGELMFAIR
jgi:3-hydroxyacyl-[acyl-carrier-protein] dehydratase